MHKILCVTACPTGIAHTYIAAEMLEKTGKKLGYQMIVETNGAIGVENRLKEKDIQEAIGIIIASDISIDRKRFDSKKMVEVSTQEAIRNPEDVIKKLIELSQGAGI